MKLVTVKKHKDSQLEVAFSSNNNNEAMAKAKELSQSNYLCQVHEVPNAHKRMWNESLVNAPVKKKASSKKKESEAQNSESD